MFTIKYNATEGMVQNRSEPIAKKNFAGDFEVKIEPPKPAIVQPH